MGLLAVLKNRVMKSSRQNKLNQFYARYRGGPVLDAGVSGRSRVENENIFLHSFKGDRSLYTALGVEDLTELSNIYIKSRFITYNGKLFPFRDNEFEWVFSNAVIEHVGTYDDQLQFLNEMMRVGKNVFFTTPNRWFPIESHTNAFFLHWLPSEIFFKWSARYKPYWTKDNLNLLDYQLLVSLLADSNAKEYEIIPNRLLGWTMTFSVFCSARNS
ncbi:MAG: methyltransferase domain-containing protein [Proteobacteria bacterium]|nr:methyltransferase domain-containing protein [Pseudomonadota bacterium]